MIAIAVEVKPTYLPTSTGMLNLLFGGLSRHGTSFSTRTRMLGSRGSKVSLHVQSLEPKRSTEECISSKFDLPVIEAAFDCEFIQMPDSINSAEDFRNWIMEMKI